VRRGGNTIGFIANERRSNVALSRAKDLLIVLGIVPTLKSKRQNPCVDWMEHCEYIDAYNVISDDDRM
jgi:superfamily I DNA and/or RNA helicase